MSMNVQTLLDAVESTGAGSALPMAREHTMSMQCVVAGTGAVTATVDVEVSNDNSTWESLVTFELSGTTSASDGAVQNPMMWPFVRGNITAITGTGAAVTLTIGV
jgi:hypothetical protein